MKIINKTIPISDACSMIRAGYRIFIILILLTGQISFGQAFPDNARFLPYPVNEIKQKESEDWNESHFMDNFIQETGNLPSQNELKKEAGYIAMIDSIYEIQNLGYINEEYRWYFHFNQQQKMDSSWRRYYNPDGGFENITEIRSYNNDGQIMRLVKKQPDLVPYLNEGDTTLIEAYIEENTYQGKNLVKKITQSTSYGSTYVTEEYHTYNQENQLIRDSIIENGSSPNVTAYTYTIDNDLEYILYYSTYDGIAYGIRKYEYVKTDTSQFITRHWIYYPFLEENPIPDTISHWQGEHYFYETYDESGRKIGLRVEYYNIYDGRSIQYRAEYSYTANNALLHASYFDWIGEPDSGIWQEAMRIDNTYDEKGNLVVYEKTFYDARTGEWAVENSKTYFYTLAPVSIPEDHKQQSQLTLFPNPAKEVITIDAQFTTDCWYVLIDLHGSIVGGGMFEDKTIPVSQLKPGLYIVKLYSQQSVFTGKLIKN